MNDNLFRNTLTELSAIGKDPNGGLTRLLFTESWMRAQQALKAAFEKAGLAARFDEAGNLYGRAQGTEKGTVLTGSHVDTVRNGGHLDGQYGIVAGFAAIKRLLEKHGPPKKSLEVVSFAEEEGSRFPYVFWGSKNVVGIADRDKVREAKAADGATMPEAMRALGFDFEKAPEPRKDIDAFVEIHIEQGGVLEKLGRQIGIVTAIVGQKRYVVRLKGKANHAGTTPMGMRLDAMECSARCMVALLDEARREGDPLVLTFGRIELKPGVGNVVPGEALFSVDTRHTDRAVLDRFAGRIEATIRETAEKAGIGCEIERVMDEPPVPMDTGLTALFGEVCKAGNLSHHVMHSGAGHDCQIMAAAYPSAMLFVPSINGISHNPEENTEFGDLLAGVDALEGMLHRLAYR